MRVFPIGFLGRQLCYLVETYPHRRTWQHKLWTVAEAAGILANYLRWLTSFRGARPSAGLPGPTCVVVLLTHHRPQNLPLLVRAALVNDFVAKVIVSNSNPRVKIADWITEREPRLLLTDEACPTGPGFRFVLAEREPANHFLSVDDDLFLSPGQWSALFGALLRDESVPHGICGNLYRPGTVSSNGSPFHHVAGVEQEVDVLIGAYAFTRQHLLRLAELAKAAGLWPLTELANGEDILLSFAGRGRPRIHDVGRVFTCASNSLPGVALWRTQEGFWPERIRLFETVSRLRRQMPPADTERQRPSVDPVGR